MPRFELVHEWEQYHDYEPAEGYETGDTPEGEMDHIGEIIRVTLVDGENADGPHTKDYVTMLDFKTRRITREEAERIIREGQ